MTHLDDGTRPLSILVVDDVEDAASSTATVLNMCGFVARTAYSGEAAIEAAHAESPDVVIFDIHMPGMDGWELARRLRQNAGEKRPLLVAVTALASEADHRKSDEVGIDLHLVKPVDPAALVGLVRRFRQVVAPSVGCPPPPTP
jgi:CheY-like chemotaxis protein